MAQKGIDTTQQNLNISSRLTLELEVVTRNIWLKFVWLELGVVTRNIWLKFVWLELGAVTRNIWVKFV